MRMEDESSVGEWGNMSDMKTKERLLGGGEINTVEARDGGVSKGRRQQGQRLMLYG